MTEDKEREERKFRRGYSQGWYFAVEMLREGFSFKQVDAMTDQLYDWRSQEPTDERIEPQFSQRLKKT